MTLLQALRIFGPITINELVPKLGVDREAVWQRLSKLKTAGHAAKVGVRGGYANRREESLYDITDAGRDAYEARIAKQRDDEACRYTFEAAMQRLPLFPEDHP